LKKNFDNIDIKFIKGSGGIFEVLCDGQLIFSKSREGRFPNPGEIGNKLKKIY